jgi:molybdate transport system substrate-binding protein
LNTARLLRSEPTLDRSRPLGIKGFKIGTCDHRLQNTTEAAKTTVNTMTEDIRVMTSGAFTAAYLELLPRLELLTKKKLVTAATSIGTGESSIPNRLRRGEAVDVVIVADGVLLGFIKDGLVLAESYTPLARSAIGMAVRAGAPKPDLSTVDALKRTLLQAKSIAYSASVSGDYVSTELFQRLGIADQVVGKSRRIEGGERVGAVIARGEAEIGFQQLSELLPVPGIDHITPLPPEVQKVSTFSAGIARTTRDSTAAHALIRFLASAEAARAITDSGLEPIGNR